MCYIYRHKSICIQHAKTNTTQQTYLQKLWARQVSKNMLWAFIAGVFSSFLVCDRRHSLSSRWYKDRNGFSTHGLLNKISNTKQLNYNHSTHRRPTFILGLKKMPFFSVHCHHWFLLLSSMLLIQKSLSVHPVRSQNYYTGSMINAFGDCVTPINTLEHGFVIKIKLISYVSEVKFHKQFAAFTVSVFFFGRKLMHFFCFQQRVLIALCILYMTSLSDPI